MILIIGSSYPHSGQSASLCALAIALVSSSLHLLVWGLLGTPALVVITLSKPRVFYTGVRSDAAGQRLAQAPPSTQLSAPTKRRRRHTLWNEERRDPSQEDPPQGAQPAKAALPYGAPSPKTVQLPISRVKAPPPSSSLRRVAMMAARPWERRLPHQPLTTATTSRPPPASPYRRRQLLSTALTLLESQQLSQRPHRRSLTGRHLRRAAISAACLRSGDSLNRPTRPRHRTVHAQPPATTAYPNRSPIPPSRHPRLARMERRLPKPSITALPHRTPLPARYLER
ncbi:hypothetical protein WOLCODRAFT_159240 [Wolfiporia cocos MD-104 SS10]|uniref:Uncharacterized protein n=1 Tax=Wolfiporia cocos (strain MD-104) TaxID=742152 RepID=A0A2H3JBT9_WOLCO|nr:hypothetical protein WOLCODRAFT_159240 [Wolfiporia cocos MD-104 SS10]